jgi:hypothetical protein
LSSATCCFRVCKSHPTRIMSQPSIGVTSWPSAQQRLPATSGCSHDISNGSAARQPSAPPSHEDDPCGRFPAVSLLTELDASLTEHHHCGDLDAGVDGPIVWIGCECEARMARRGGRGLNGPGYLELDARGRGLRGATSPRARVRQRTERRVATRDPGSRTAVSLTAAYFASHLLAGGRSSSCHIPPAFTQSSRFVYWLKSRDVSLGGLAEGELDESLDALGAVVAPLGLLNASGGFVSLPE